MRFALIAALALAAVGCSHPGLGSAKTRQAFIYAVCDTQLEGEKLVTDHYGTWVCKDFVWVKQ